MKKRSLDFIKVCSLKEAVKEMKSQVTGGEQILEHTLDKGIVIKTIINSKTKIPFFNTRQTLHKRKYTCGQ